MSVPWELVARTELDLLQRLPVPGGWLYRTLVWSHNRTGEVPYLTVAMVFVPTPAVEEERDHE